MSGLNDAAARIAQKIAELEAERSSLPRSERRPVNQKLHMLRDMLRWTKTREGYGPTPQDLGLLD